MIVKFMSKGLSFVADIVCSMGEPARLTGNPDNRSDGELPSVEFKSLSCGEYDAMFLLDSELLDELESAAFEAAEGLINHARDIDPDVIGVCF